MEKIVLGRVRSNWKAFLLELRYGPLCCCFFANLANLIKGGDKKRHKYTTSKLIE
jgi:hypothetical protein